MQRRSYLTLAATIALAGCIGGDDDDGEDQSETGADLVSDVTPLRDDAVEAEPADLLPTLDDFDDDWREQDRSPSHVVFVSAVEASNVEFRIDMFETIDEGQTLYENRLAETREEYDVEGEGMGAQAFSFQPERRTFTIVLRAANVVGTVEYNPGPGADNPEESLVEYAEILADSINV